MTEPSLSKKTQLVCCRQLPTAPNAAVDVHRSIPNDQELLSCGEGPCEWGSAWIAAANLPLHHLGVRGLQQSARANPDVGLHCPHAKGRVYRTNEFVKVLRPS